MGFCAGSYATVWEVKQGNGNYLDCRISISKRNKETQQYDTDFSGYVRLVGTAAKKGASLKEKDRIRIWQCDVSNNYNKEKNITYYNPVIFDFEKVESNATSGATATSVGGAKPMSTDEFMNIPDDADSKLPFD